MKTSNRNATNSNGLISTNSTQTQIGNATDNNYYITRPNGRSDGGVVRVMFAIFSNRIDYTLCYAVASAYFTNIPVVVVGHNVKQYSHIARHHYWRHAIQQAGLKDDDIMVTLDSDILFTGLDYFPFIDKFIKLSPANLNELDAKAVRTGEALPPVLYGTQGGCWYPQTLQRNFDLCIKKWNEYEEKIMAYNLTKIKKQLDYAIYDYSKSYQYINYHYHDKNNFTHVNGGSSIKRVWAMKDIVASITKFTVKNKSIDDKSWWQDQSILAKLYLQLRLWQVQQDYFRKSSKQLLMLTNQYGLHAGQLGLDVIGEFSVMMHPTLSKDFELSTQHWHQAQNIFSANKANVFDAQIPGYIQQLYNTSKKTKTLFTKRRLTHSYSNVHNVTISPPLLSVVPRHINGKDKPAQRVFPWLIHFASSRKQPRYKSALNFIQWSLPMKFDNDEYEKGKQYVMSMPIELWSTTEKYHVRYRDVCIYSPFKTRPFN